MFVAELLRAAEVGDPVRVIEVDPLVSPLPTELPDELPAVVEPEREENEVGA